MARGSGIEWTESTWNPVTGCTKVSPGCKHFYAERMAERLQAMGQQNYVNGFRLTLQPHMLDLPLQWKKPQTIFVNSTRDLFHDGVPGPLRDLDLNRMDWVIVGGESGPKARAVDPAWVVGLRNLTGPAGVSVRLPKLYPSKTPRGGRPCAVSRPDSRS
ncbi:MAG TPA: DUF5131 family protein [Thermoanaerobaculia bacterium]|nr:DUF5131 family protein [Thermoanaerobaculia bacterium]